MPKRLLLVEDDLELGQQLATRLRDAGFDPIWWREGKTLTPATFPDAALVVLDLMLPSVYGLDMLKELRAFSEVPVLVLSARNDTADKVRALQLGADDYLTKPFWPAELLERIRARLRRPMLQRERVVAVGGLTLDLESREVHVDGQKVELTRLELDFLAVLAERPGAAFTRKSLADRVLAKERDGTERTLDVHVSRIRKKLGPETFIETVWGIGYRLATKRDE